MRMQMDKIIAVPKAEIPAPEKKHITLLIQFND